MRKIFELKMGNAKISSTEAYHLEENHNDSRYESIASNDKSAQINYEKTKSLISLKIKASNTSGELILRDLDIKQNSDVWGQLSPFTLAHVKVLDISENEVKRLPLEILRFEGLKCLIASSCALQRLISLAGLLEVEIIMLDHNDLEDVTTGAFPNICLRTLDLSNNHFRTFPRTVVPLTNLKVLNLNCNRITSLIGVGTLTSLEVLGLDDNHLNYLPEEMASLINLHELSIKRNLLCKTKAASNMQSIDKLFFTATQIEYIAIDGNVELSYLDLLQFEGADKYKLRNEEFVTKGCNPRIESI